MKKYLYIVLIILLIIGGTFLFGNLEKKDQNSVEDNSETQNSAENTQDTEGFVGFDYKDWRQYKNSEYNFYIKYPSDWEAQESLKPQDETALHEIVFSEKEYETYRSDFKVYIFANEDKNTTEEWWSLRLAKEDLKKTDCVKENGENSPCLFLRDLIRKEEGTTLGGFPAHLVRIFQFDSERECIYSAHGDYVYGVCYSGENPNDPLFDQHKEAAKHIKESLSFVNLSESKNEDKIIGSWKSLDDEKSIKVFEKNGIAKEVYGKETLENGTWELTGEDSLKIVMGEEEYLYSILKINTSELELSYLPRGNTLRYTIVD